MTVREALEYVDELYESPFSLEMKLIWLNQIEAEIQVEVLLTAVEGIVQYGEDDLDAELIAPAPFDSIYPEYLIWRFYLAQNEAENANNQHEVLNQYYLAYVRYVADTIDPGSGKAERLRYYLTAYQIAVKLGFIGTEEEWVKSLKGEKGDPFTYEDFTDEQLAALKGVDFTTDETLILDPETKVLRVNTADAVEQDNTLPITSAAVHTTVGNIEALLATI